ncbi:MAG: hypothetical protein ACKPEO_02620 [Sphaerospermopsis kisseleviana]
MPHSVSVDEENLPDKIRVFEPAANGNRPLTAEYLRFNYPIISLQEIGNRK